MIRYEIGDDGAMVEAPASAVVPPGWVVTDQHGSTVAMAPGPVAAEMTGTSNEGSADDGSDRAGSSEPDS